MIYFDNAATTKISPDILQAMVKVSNEYFANPSSIHTEGLKAKKIIQTCRNNILKIINAENMNLYFTSGATESNNLAIKGFCKERKGNVISIRIEHDSILEPLNDLKKEGITVTYIEVDSKGQIDLKQLSDSFREDTVLMTFSIVNNETGIIQQNYKKIVELCHEHNVRVHTDAVQTFGHLDADYSIFDMVTFTSHKIHGPRGIGALLVNKEVKLSPVITGGGQENNARGGTENTALIYGFYLAVKNICKDMKLSYVKSIKEYVLSQMKKVVPEIIVNEGEENIPHILNVTLPFDGDTILSNLNANGVYVSSGSACINNSDSYSHVIYELTKSKERAKCSIRISFGMYSTMQEAEDFALIFKTVINSLINMEIKYA